MVKSLICDQQLNSLKFIINLFIYSVSTSFVSLYTYTPRSPLNRISKTSKKSFVILLWPWFPRNHTTNKYPLLTAEDIWFFCSLSLKFIPPINIWKIWIDLRLFSKYLHVPLLRSKDNQCWILRLRTRNFVIISESVAANLKKVKRTSVWPKVLIYWSFLCSSKTYSCKSCNKKDIKVK